MNLFSAVSFGPAEIREAVSGTGSRRCVMAVLTSQTCGEPCWHAREEVCRCSCGGRNHGCLLIPGVESPERSAKIDGERYRLLAVGLRNDVTSQAAEINGRNWRQVCRPSIIIESQGASYTEADAEKARSEGKRVWYSQYKYRWSETDAGAPARIKYATKDQLARWTELKGWQDQASIGVCLLWERVTMPEAPTEPVIDKETGKPI